MVPSRGIQYGAAQCLLRVPSTGMASAQWQCLVPSLGARYGDAQYSVGVPSTRMPGAQWGQLSAWCGCTVLGCLVLGWVVPGQMPSTRTPAPQRLFQYGDAHTWCEGLLPGYPSPVVAHRVLSGDAHFQHARCPVGAQR